MSILQVQQRTASGLTNVGQFPQSIVGSMGSAIIESGSNANGNYVKFADGTLICTKRLNGLGPITLAVSAGLYASGNIEVGTWSAVFISPPFCAYLSTDSVKWIPTWIRSKNTPTTTWGSQINIVCTTSTNTTDFSVSAIAIGQWY